MTSYPAPAKINLHLNVTGILENGYHELNSSFAYVDIADRIDITPHHSLEVTCSNPAFSGENNLAHQVLDALRKKTGVTEGVRVHVEKLLPDRAGLGGGSSDAATALMVANKLWQLNLSTEELIAFAAPYGADIPCFLFGEASLATGVGEKLTPYSGSLPEIDLLLAYPGVGLSTPKVFRKFDSEHTDEDTLTGHNGVDTIRAHSVQASENRNTGTNDLEASACQLSGEVSNLLKWMRTRSDLAWMSGSGSACVALFDDKHSAEKSAEALRRDGLATWTHVGRLLKEHPLRKQL